MCYYRSACIFFFCFQFFHDRNLSAALLPEEGDGFLILIQFRAMLFPVLFLKPCLQEIFLDLPDGVILPGEMDLFVVVL